MIFGSLLQLIGAAVAIIWAIAVHQWWIAFFVGVHFTGDTIEGLFTLPGFARIELEAKRYVKLRPFLLFVGLALMLVGRDTHIDVMLGSFHLITSNGLFILGFFLAMIGAFTYDLIYT